MTVSWPGSILSPCSTQGGRLDAFLSGLCPAKVLARWRADGADNRRRFRKRGDVVDTSIGDYPCRWQAVHVAAELATHADDIGVPVTPGEHAERAAWRARYSRFDSRKRNPSWRPGMPTRVRPSSMDRPPQSSTTS